MVFFLILFFYFQISFSIDLLKDFTSNIIQKIIFDIRNFKQNIKYNKKKIIIYAAFDTILYKFIYASISKIIKDKDKKLNDDFYKNVLIENNDLVEINKKTIQNFNEKNTNFKFSEDEMNNVVDFFKDKKLLKNEIKNMLNFLMIEK